MGFICISSCDDFYEAKIGNVGENVLLHTLIEIVLILLISELSYRFIENPLRKFHYKDTFRTVRNWFSKPVISRQNLGCFQDCLFP